MAHSSEKSPHSGYYKDIKGQPEINKVVDIVKSPEARQDEIQTATRVLNFAVRCFCRLSEYRTTRDILRQILPDALKTHGLAKKLQSEEEVIAMITQINQNLMPQHNIH